VGDRGLRHLQPLTRTLAAWTLALSAVACAPPGDPVSGAASLGLDPRGVVDIGTAAVGPLVQPDGRVTIVAVRPVDGAWSASPLTTSPGAPGTDSLHLLSWGGATGEEWNTIVYGTAAPGTVRVVLDGYPDQRGGMVVDGAWVIALREQDLGPPDIRWTFIDADGTTRTGTGIFPPDARRLTPVSRASGVPGSIGPSRGASRH